jgi:uncharacterized membrane protein YhiD involved in acid resistance
LIVLTLAIAASQRGLSQTSDRTGNQTQSQSKQDKQDKQDKKAVKAQAKADTAHDKTSHSNNVDKPDSSQDKVYAKAAKKYPR